MFDVYFISYGKNHKSTEQPTLSGVTPYSCKLKAPCSILSPIVEMQIPPVNQGNWVNVNYAYIPDFHRYYFVTNKTLEGKLVVFSLKVDVLASWKTAITGSNQYVLRAASDYDGTIKDTKYPVKAVNPDYSGTYGTQKANPFQPGGSYTLGSFVVGVVAKGCPFGTVNYYAMSQLVFINFMLQLFNLPTQWGSGGQDLAEGLKKAITDPMQYVVTCLWYPYSVNDYVNLNLVTAVTSVTVGYDTFSLSATAYAFNTAVNLEITNVESVTIPSHPQASRGSYLNYEPYSRYYLSFYPFCPLVELDSSQVGGIGTLYLVYSVDIRTGKGILSVCRNYNGSTNPTATPRSPIRVFEAQLGVPVPVATIHTELQNLSQYLTSSIAAVGTEFGGFKQSGSRLVDTFSNWIATGIQKVMSNDDAAQQALEQFKSELQPITKEDISNIASNAAAMKSTCEAIGSQGTMSLYSKMPLAAWGNFYYVAEDNLGKYGRPLCKTKTLSSLSGFVQCDNPFITGSGMTLSEQLEIEQMLAQGIYIA